MLTGNPIEIAVAIFAVFLTFTALASIISAIVDRNRSAGGTGVAVNTNNMPANSAGGIVQRNAKRAA
ncbi:MAG TPA: hypothetical protein VK943_01420 [Arenibaculum sp.]|nr:hypothetical protein [Arenibaculum sp.]